MGSFLGKGCRVSGKTVDQRCPGLRFFDPSLFARYFSFLVSKK